MTRAKARLKESAMKSSDEAALRAQPLLQCACALVVGAAGCADSPARQEILRNNEALFHAIAARDVAMLSRVTAPDFRYEHQGQTGDRKAFLDAIATRTSTVEWITNEDLRLRVDGDHAILCGVQRAMVLLEGQRIADQGTFCDRWEKRDGKWLVTFAGEPTSPR
jgi:hypothetical protein